MFKYIFTSSLLILGIAISLNAQSLNQSEGNNQQQGQDEQENAPKKKKKIPYPNKKRGTSIGINFVPIAMHYMDSDRFGVEANIKTNFKERMFLTGTLGIEEVAFDDKSYDYESSGIYATIGFDYDIFIVEEAKNNDNIVFGFRYGMAVQQHQSDKITISNSYWGEDFTTSISPYTINTHWVELVAGLRSQLLNNLYMNLYAHLKGKIASNNSEIMEAYLVPGFGTGSSNLQLGFSYIIEYTIPWGNKK